MGAFLVDRDQGPKTVGFLLLGQPDGDKVLGRGERNEDDKAVAFEDAVSAKCQIFNGAFNQKIILVGEHDTIG